MLPERGSDVANRTCERRKISPEPRPNIANHMCERHEISPERRPSIANRICARRKISPERRPNVANRICERRTRSSDGRPNVANRFCARRKISPEWRPNVAHGTCECRKISPERRPNVTDIFYERCLAPRERACTLRLATWTRQPRNLWSARARTRSAPFFTCMDQVLRNRVFTCCMLDARAARAIKFWATSKTRPRRGTKKWPRHGATQCS